MKRFVSFFSAALILTLLSCNVVKNPRLTDNFNDGWKFHLGDTIDPQSPEFNDQIIKAAESFRDKASLRACSMPASLNSISLVP